MRLLQEQTKRPLKTLFVAAIGVTMASAFVLPAMAQDVFRIGIDAAYRPFAFVDEQGNLAGFEVELAEAVCAKMERECEISNVPWDGIFAALESNTIDMIGTTVTKSAARLEIYDASTTIYRVGFAYIVPTGTDTSQGIDGLKGQPIGTVTATEVFYKFIKGTLGEDADIRAYDSPDAAILDLDAGRIAAYMGDNLQLGEQFVSSGDYEFVAKPVFEAKWTGDGRGWMFRKDSGDMVTQVDDALTALLADGTVDKIGQAYFGISLGSK